MSKEFFGINDPSNFLLTYQQQAQVNYQLLAPTIYTGNLTTACELLTGIEPLNENLFELTVNDLANKGCQSARTIRDTWPRLISLRWHEVLEQISGQDYRIDNTSIRQIFSPDWYLNSPYKDPQGLPHFDYRVPLDLITAPEGIAVVQARVMQFGEQLQALANR